MFDTASFYLPIAKKISLKSWGLHQKKFIFCTIHRQENTDNLKNLQQILKALQKLSKSITVVFAVHPRTRKVISQNRKLKEILTKCDSDFKAKILNKNQAKKKTTKLKILDPLGYLETQRMVMGARVVMTDSGGLQKEAYFHNVPCITLRTETEWVETLKNGYNVLTELNYNKIFKSYSKIIREKNINKKKNILKNASKKILKTLIIY